jgi:hypothetical protein
MPVTIRHDTTTMFQLRHWPWRAGLQEYRYVGPRACHQYLRLLQHYDYHLDSDRLWRLLFFVTHVWSGYTTMFFGVIWAILAPRKWHAIYGGSFVGTGCTETQRIQSLSGGPEEKTRSGGDQHVQGCGRRTGSPTESITTFVIPT